jgi:hypothetical protein
MQWALACQLLIEIATSFKKMKTTNAFALMAIGYHSDVIDGTDTFH